MPGNGALVAVGVLRRIVDRHLVIHAGDGQGAHGLQVEVGLGPVRSEPSRCSVPGSPALRVAEPIQVAAGACDRGNPLRHVLIGVLGLADHGHRGVLVDGLVQRQHGGQVFVGDALLLDERGRLSGRGDGFRDRQPDGGADGGHHAVAEYGIVLSQADEFVPALGMSAIVMKALKSAYRRRSSSWSASSVPAFR